MTRAKIIPLELEVLHIWCTLGDRSKGTNISLRGVGDGYGKITVHGNELKLIYTRHLEGCDASDNYTCNINERNSSLLLLHLLVGSRLKHTGKDKFPGMAMSLSLVDSQATVLDDFHRQMEN